MSSIRPLLAVAAAAALGFAVVPGIVEEDASTDESERAAIADVLADIESGGPLPYEEDGQTFQNREGLLPAKPLGYYREYTVETPGSPDRGARRLVIGERDETYYTDDHYGSFTRIDPEDYGQ